MQDNSKSFIFLFSANTFLLDVKANKPAGGSLSFKNLAGVDLAAAQSTAMTAISAIAGSTIPNCENGQVKPNLT